MKPLALALALSALLAVASGAQAGTPEESAPPTSDQRPRICLALSGGGAVGLAQVGVLRALEELHVPVDCVAGTSMGAIVGGLYAAGYSPAELEEIVQSLDWASLLRDQPDRRRLPFRRKIDDLTYLTRWELGFSRSGFKTPAGLVSGHRLGVELHRLALRASGAQDFDQLALPFRAVATDPLTGEPVALDHGDLAAALRASMAIPGLFSPVEIDGRLLVDGGLVANVPVATARSLGGDVVLAVDLEQPLATRERPESLAAILGGSLSALSRRETERALSEADLVVRPSVEEYGLLDFPQAETLIERGAQAVLERQGDLQALSVDDEAWERHLAAQRRSDGVMEIASVTVDPGPGLSPAAVARSVHTRPGRPLDREKLAADLDRLWELGEFETVDFSLEPLAGGTWDLRIVAHRKSWGPNFLRFGVALASDLEGTSSFSVLNSATMTRLNRLGAELKVSVVGGEQTGIVGELYQPLTRSGGPFVAVTLGASPTKVQVPIGSESVQYRFFNERGILDLGFSLGRFGEVRAGVVRSGIQGRPSQRHAGDAPHFDSNDAGYRGRLTFDQLDRVNFPRNGLLAVAELYDSSPGLGADEDYRRFDLQIVAAATRGRSSVVLLTHGGTALGGELPDTGRIYLGGLFNLSGQPPGELSGSYGGVASLLYLYRLGGIPNFADGLYLGASVERGNVWETSDEVDLGDLREAYSVVLGVDTLLGPIYAGHGWTAGGKDSFYLYVGRTF